ncbi:hypothetical protein EON63_24900, partial [archaeon]
MYTFMDEQRETTILHNPDQHKALYNKHKAQQFPHTQSKQRVQDSLEIDMNNIFHRLYYNPQDPYSHTRPRSAPTHGSNKMRVMKLLGEEGMIG